MHLFFNQIKAIIACYGDSFIGGKYAQLVTFRPDDRQGQNHVIVLKEKRGGRVVQQNVGV